MTAACPACAAVPAARELARVTGDTITLSVPGMKCAACIGKIERKLAAIGGVQDARVNLTLKRVTARTALPPATLVAALKDIGFDAYPFDTEHIKSHDDATAKDLILRLGVAGFAMMNVMLLSVAIWSGAGDATRDLFHLISASIAIPATAFAAQPFFTNAWRALIVRQLNMDVPISLAIILAAGMSLFEALNGGEHAYFDAALSLTFFLLIGRVLEHRTRAAAKSAAADLAALETHMAKRKTPHGYQDIPAADLCVGDTVLVASGMRAPADGTLVEDTALTDRSFLTGESAPVRTQTGAVLRAGEINLGAPFHIKANAVGDQTSLRKMAQLVETAESTRNSYTSIADRAARIYAPAVHLLALITFLGWFAATGDLRHALNIAIAVLIITCPCALGLAVPAVATAAIGRLFAMGFLVKSGTALERLAEVDGVVFDKTGTLTLPAWRVCVDGLNTEQRAVAKALAQASAHPVSKALAAGLSDTRPAPLTQITEEAGKGVAAVWNGQPVALGSGRWLGGETPALTLAIGQTHIEIPTREALRPGTRPMLDALRAQGLGLSVLSGDTARKTRDLSETLNIGDWHAGIRPKDKHDLISRMQNGDRHVAMVGDGINDTAALAAAHVSLAPGSALDAARNAADIILLRQSFDALPQLFRIARASVALSKQNFAIAALYNAIAIPIAVAGFATPLLAALAMSASSITVLLNALRVRIVK